jgi:aminopeptidase-like protein
MSLNAARPAVDVLDGRALYELARELYPLCRSITGNGVRQTLARLADFVPLTIHEVPSGRQVLDWTVPLEWNIHDAWIATTDGRRVVDFREHSLHIVSYSRPVRARLRRDELESHLYSLPDRPDWIPYRTSYYADTWGFCLSHRQRSAMTEEYYDVCVDTTLAPGSLTYGEVVLPGQSSDEVLLSAHVCHPSLANDNLSGLVTLVSVCQQLERLTRRRYTYRLLFGPGTIGALTWLALHDAEVARIKHGLVVACVGDSGGFTYKRSRHETADVDRAAEHVLKHSGTPYSIRSFSPDGYDERQYATPGYNLPVGRLTRTANGEYPEYHTSADNLDLIKPENLGESADLICRLLEVLDANEAFVNTNPKGEPHLGRRGLYRNFGGLTETLETEAAIRLVLSFSDGTHSLLDIAERSGLSFRAVQNAAGLLVQHDLLRARPVSRRPEPLAT